jgi:hypothetical protein
MRRIGQQKPRRYEKYRLFLQKNKKELLNTAE